jgi:ABC-type Mn2+/Zn2+ transport system ATPase subunit
VNGPWVLRDVDAEVGAGQLIRVSGPNGSGKSTLLRLISGASVPSRGRITDRPRAGYVPERFPPGLPFSARGYLMHLGRVHGLRGPALARTVGDGIEQLGLADYAGTPLRELSKGTAQKVAVAQALLARPRLLVLDEAWTGLDERTRAVLDGAVAERRADGAAVVFVDHDPARLAGQVTVRWNVGRGRVTPEAGPGSANRLGRVDEPGDPVLAVEPVLAIEIEGYAADPVALTARPGVLAAEHTAGQPGGVRLRVRAGASDDVLRHVLGAGPAVHVGSVRPEPGLDSQP